MLYKEELDNHLMKLYSNNLFYIDVMDCIYILILDQFRILKNKKETKS